ncbi:MAG TPA: hypothetical protein VGR47_23325 [Terracidiphilus sp.]|nr:hypothetical protein [Terracidiphilus sp.]
MNSPAAPHLDFSFPRNWNAEILPARPAILPAHHFTYPREAEEIERGALEVLVRPRAALADFSSDAPGPAPGTRESSQASLPRISTPPFLATCALGFRDPAAPTGLWSTPHPDWLCAVSGGYAYLIDTTLPERFEMLSYRPVLEVRAAIADNLLLFIGHQRILAWGSNRQIWESEKLSDEGLTVADIEPGILRGRGWEMQTDKERPFALDLHTGQRIS